MAVCCQLKAKQVPSSSERLARTFSRHFQPFLTAKNTGETFPNCLVDMTDIRRGQDAKLDENDPFRVIATMVPVQYSNNHDYISDTMRCPNRAECAPYCIYLGGRALRYESRTGF